MAAKGDVKAVRVDSTGSVFAGRTRLRGIIVENTNASAAQSITLQDENGTQFISSCPAGDVFAFNLPEDGILFKGFMTVNAIGADVAATVLLDK
jgi:Holliday junction resolvasome RuvABC DNA-binding subunit